MRIVVTLDSQRTEVDVRPDGSSASWPGGSAPIKLIRVTGRVAELEVGGERVLVEGWPEYLPTAPSEVTINGETFRLVVERGGEALPPTAAVPPPAASRDSTSPPAAPGGTGTVVTPPMPGKVVELRVREGERVVAGQVLLVIEAMKMRNEVASPVPGVVRALSVTAGVNVRARDPLLRIAPD